ncbi:IclR family transcriptional regulator [Saliphagus infecundisoli]|uniref:IclR family transcriptional regulator n=1 Tax=Saliphagus infecundisoli TaxID=1849069 RepID=A0ABD5QDG4_9EURY|nr:IclR family transcriptional regulator [Saliphagus infecundisoli]
MGGTTGQSLTSVETAFTIVGRLAEVGWTTPTELADALEMPTSTAHVYLKTMAEAGYLARADGRYRLSLRFLCHGAHLRREFEIYEVAGPELASLAEATGEVASLGIEEGGERVLLDKVEGENAVYDKAPTGEFTRMHWTSLGKTILAHLPEERVHAIVDDHGLPEATERTITDRDELFAELESIRESGYAIEDEERRENIRAVAVPIFTDGAVAGSISVSGPVSRFSDARIGTELVAALEDRANVIELRLRHY